MEAIVKAEGRIDVLVNNAGYGSYGAVEDVTIEEARKQFDVNVFGVAMLTQGHCESCEQSTSQDALHRGLHGQTPCVASRLAAHPLVRCHDDACKLITPRVMNILIFPVIVVLLTTWGLYEREELRDGTLEPSWELYDMEDRNN